MSPNAEDQQSQAPVQDAPGRAGTPSLAQDGSGRGGPQADRLSVDGDAPGQDPQAPAVDRLMSVGEGVDPLGDVERLREEQRARNFATVGSARPSTLLYTYGPGAIMDLPHFTVMPTGLHDWDRIWERRGAGAAPVIHAPRLLETIQLILDPRVSELRPYPHQEKETSFSRQGSDLGVPARIFPQWMRCTGCDKLAPLADFVGAAGEGYTNVKRHRPDEAVVEHVGCPGRQKGGKRAAPEARRSGRARKSPCVPARYLLACPMGHLDEFPYDWWVHQGGHCTQAARPALTMSDRGSTRGASAVIRCKSCGASRPMSQAQGEVGRSRLPQCRGRFPHLDAFTTRGCDQEVRLMLVGASNLWFPATQSIIDMPRLDPQEILGDRANALVAAIGEDLGEFAANMTLLRMVLKTHATSSLVSELLDLDNEELGAVVGRALAPAEDEEARLARRAAWSPTDLLVPEWRYLLKEPSEERHEDGRTGLTLSPRSLADHPVDGVSRVLAVDRLRKVNALLGFTRIDDFDRVDDSRTRLVPLTRGTTAWVPATEDRGEGVFIQLDEDRVAQWEARVESSALWAAHVAAHRRNFERRYSETAKTMDHMERMQPARYWLVHTLAHALIRQMAMYSGYGAASISERLYAWKKEERQGAPQRPPAAGLLLVTTASDSDGTLGGLVSLSEPALLQRIVRRALERLGRCSSDPVCARRVPQDPEDFLHGAACHCCVMASETSCERANRFLDRRLVVPVPGELNGQAHRELAFFTGE